MEQIGRRIRKYREERGLSQEELGKRMGGMTKSFISKLENGHKKINLEHLQQISDILGINVSDLIPEEDRIMVQEDEWAFLFDELKEQGLSAEEVRNMIEIARKHIKNSE